MSIVSPVKGTVSSEFGRRAAIPGVAPAMLHAGIDIAAPTGRTVVAAYAGTIIAAGWGIVAGRTGYGILIENPDRERQYYGHLSKISVKVGQKVKAGQKIGEVGATGNVTGPHLHFEIWGNNNPSSARNPRLDFKYWGVEPGSTPKTSPISETKSSQRKAKANVRRRESPTTSSKNLGNSLKKGQVGNFTHWTKGEKVKGNNIWFKGISGNYFWSGAFTSTSTSGLKEEKTKAKKSNTTIAKEVIAGKWGNGEARKTKLKAAGYNYDAVQKEVNRLL